MNTLDEPIDRLDDAQQRRDHVVRSSLPWRSERLTECAPSFVIDDLDAASGMRFLPTTTGGGCTALTSTTETGHEVLVTNGDAQIPTASDDIVRISAHSPDSGEIVVTDHARTNSAAPLLQSVLARIPRHAEHLDDDGTVYCDQCPSAHRSFTEALGLI